MTSRDDKSHAAAVEFAATHFEQYGLSHLQIGHPWTGVTLADALRAFTPSHVVPKPEETVLWWNGIRRSDPEGGVYPSVSEDEDTNHDIPLYSGVNPCNVEAPQDSIAGSRADRASALRHDPAAASTPSTTRQKDVAMLEGYAASYAGMDGKVDPGDVAFDIRHNMIPALASAASATGMFTREQAAQEVESRRWSVGDTLSVKIHNDAVEECAAHLRRPDGVKA